MTYEECKEAGGDRWKGDSSLGTKKGKTLGGVTKQMAGLKLKEMKMLKLTLKKDVSAIYGEPDIALVLAESEQNTFVLVATGESAAQLASYSKMGDEIEVEEFTPTADVLPKIDQAYREYRWDWGLTPDDCTVLIAQVKVPVAA